MMYPNSNRLPAALTRAALPALLSLLTLLAAPLAHGQANPFPPGKMTFQGFLTDAATPPVPLGNASPENKSVIFKIYKNATSTAPGDVLWAEQQIVTVDKGHFSVLLGEGSSISGQPHSADLSSLFIGSDASERFIGITVDNAEITPRIQFFAAPYAQLARTANSLTAGAAFGGNAQIGTAANPAFTLEFGAGKSGKHADAGKIGYETLTTGALDIIGAGTAIGGRAIKLWDNVTVNGNLGIGTPASSSFPLRFGTSLANTKLALWDDGIGSYGLGIQANQFRLHLNTAADRFSFLSAANGTEVMTIKGDGFVGIGKTVPDVKLHVAGNGAILNLEGTDHAYIQWFPDGASAGRKGWTGWGSGSDNNFTIRNEISGGHIILSTGGNVGIGTTSPAATLDINGSARTSGNVGIRTAAPGGVMMQIGQGANEGFGGLLINTGWINFGNTAEARPFEVQVRGITRWAVNTDGAVVTSSDARIKEQVSEPAALELLETVRGLRVADYSIIDHGAHGRKSHRGLIAQEVEKIMPEAVSRSSGVVPNIFAPAISATFDAGRKALTITLAKPHNLQAADVVSLLMKSGSTETTVTAVPSETSFVVTAESGASEVFVIGKRVSDFRTLNYDRIFTTGLGAIQELDRQVQALKQSEARIAEELAEKTAQIAELKQKAARVDSLEREMAEMKKLMAALAQGQARPERLAAQNAAGSAGE